MVGAALTGHHTRERIDYLQLLFFTIARSTNPTQQAARAHAQLLVPQITIQLLNNRLRSPVGLAFLTFGSDPQPLHGVHPSNESTPDIKIAYLLSSAS
jgi:hypothetical protein